MENQKTFDIFHHFGKRTQRGCNDVAQTDAFTRESRILEIQRAERAALFECAERLCAADKARTDAVLGRLGVSTQEASLACPTGSAKFSQHWRRLRTMVNVPSFNREDIRRPQKCRQSLDEEDSFWDMVRLGSQMAVSACETYRDGSPTPSMGSECSPSPVDAHTPRELRDIRLLEDDFRPTPPAVPLSRRKGSRLPVLTAKFNRANKEVADGFRLQTAADKVEAIGERLQRFRLNYTASPRPPVTAKMTIAEPPKMSPAVAPKRQSEVPPLAPTPPKVPQTKKRGTRPGTFLRQAKGGVEADRKADSDGSLQTAKEKKPRKVELQPLKNPAESLATSFKLLSSDDWMQQMNGLKIIQALAQHHSETLKTKLHEVCLVLIEQVNNLRSAVACEAMDTLAELYVDLQKTMDPEVEGTGRALLLKLAQTTSAFIHQQANLALDAMVENCSHGRILSALLNTGLSHRCVAVRGSTAQHLHQLADGLGAARTLTAGKRFTEHVLLAVSKMCVDAAPEVRHHGQTMLQKLAVNKNFPSMWKKIVPEGERRTLDKILKKAKL